MQALPGTVHGAGGTRCRCSPGSGCPDGRCTGNGPHGYSPRNPGALRHRCVHRFEAAFQAAPVIDGEHRAVDYRAGKNHLPVCGSQYGHPFPGSEVDTAVTGQPAPGGWIKSADAFGNGIQRPGPGRRVPAAPGAGRSGEAGTGQMAGGRRNQGCRSQGCGTEDRGTQDGGTQDGGIQGCGIRGCGIRGCGQGHREQQRGQQTDAVDRHGPTVAPQTVPQASDRRRRGCSRTRMRLWRNHLVPGAGGRCRGRRRSGAVVHFMEQLAVPWNLPGRFSSTAGSAPGLRTTSSVPVHWHGNLTTRVPIIPVQGVHLQRSGYAGRGGTPESFKGAG